MKKLELKTDIDKKLYEKIEPIAEKYVGGADEFIDNVFFWMDTQEKRQKLLDYIVNHNITDDQDVLELEMCIDEGSEPEFN